MSQTNGHTLPPIELRTTAKLPHSIEEINSRITAFPIPTQEAIRSLFQFGRTNALSQAQLGDIIERDASTISKLFSGKYDAEDLSQITTQITASLSHASRSTHHTPIAQVSAIQEIDELCSLAWLKHRICFIFGPTQAGKTTALKYFASQNPRHPEAAKGITGAVRYLEMPAGGSARGFLNRLAEITYRSPQSNWADLKRRVFGAFSKNDLLIIDEFSQCFNPVTGNVKIATLDLIRELWNSIGCGIVLVMTDIAKDQMQLGKFHKACDQLWFRCAAELELDRVPSDPDLKLIAETYNLPTPARDELARVRAIVHTRGMTRFTTLLELANDLAQSRGPRSKPNWPDFLAVHDRLEKLASKPQPKTKNP